MLGLFGAVWGLCGVLLLLGQGIVRLTAVGLVALSQLSTPLAWYHWAALTVWLPFMLVSEGYRGFQ